MLKVKHIFSAAVLAVLFILPARLATAAPIFVGSWQVDQGPGWNSNPLAYTAQEAAALLFGGSPSDYAISTAGSDASLINNLGWYSVLGISNGHEFAEDYTVKLAGGLYYDGAEYDDTIEGNPASAYINDNAIGAEYTNYAFRITDIVDPIDTPAPGALGLLGLSLVGLGLYRRRNAF